VQRSAHASFADRLAEITVHVHKAIWSSAILKNVKNPKPHVIVLLVNNVVELDCLKRYAEGMQSNTVALLSISLVRDIRFHVQPTQTRLP